MKKKQKKIIKKLKKENVESLNSLKEKIERQKDALKKIINTYSKKEQV